MHNSERLDIRRCVGPKSPHSPSTIRKCRAMTLCIAAICEQGDAHAIALCVDCQGTYDNCIKNDDQRKIIDLGKGAMVFCEDGAVANELSILLSPIFEQYDAVDKTEKDFDLRMNKLISDIRGVVNKIISDRAAYYLSTRYHVSPSGFKIDEWGDEIKKEIKENLKKHGLGASFIIAYADDYEPIIITVEGDGHVAWRDERYVCVGSGSDAALAILSQNDHGIDLSLMQCAGRLLAAKRTAEKTVYVGQATSWAFLIKGKKQTFDISDKGWDYLKEKVRLVDSQEHIIFQEDFIEEVQ